MTRPDSPLQRLEVVGPFRGAGGYGRHTREFVREFVRAGLDVQLTPLPGWPEDLPPALREPAFEALCRPVAADAALHFAMPGQAVPRPGGVGVNYTMFEADRIPAAWTDAARGYARIVVPCRSSLRAWVDSGVPASRLRLCPLGVDAAFFGAPSAPLPLHDAGGCPVADYRHRFLNVADLRPRKNHLGLLRAWMAATRRGDDAVLLLKAIASDAALAQLRADLAASEARLGRTLAQAAPVVFVTDALPDEAVRALYRTATHYVSLSCGEGWDLPMLEAAAAGLALIAPRHTAYLDYLTDDEAVLLPARREGAVFEGCAAAADQALFAGACWWRPDEEAAAEALRDIVHGRAPARRAPGARLGREYGWARAARRLLGLIEEACREAAGR